MISFAIAIALDNSGLHDSLIWLIAPILPIIIFFLGVRNTIKERGGSAKIASDAIVSVITAKENIQSDINLKEAKYLEVAENEYENGIINKALWSQALVNANGDEKLRKVEYMKLRAYQLKKAR